MADSQQSPERHSDWAIVRTYLVERDRLFERIADGERLSPLLLHMVAASAGFAAVYGLTIGLYAGGMQPLLVTIKIPLMLLATAALCVLALYMLNSLKGSRLSFAQTVAVVFSAVLVTTTLLVALVPPLGFLMLTSTHNYPLVIVINLLVIMVAGARGAAFAIQAIEAVHVEDVVRRRSRSLMRAWMALYGLIGMQMLWLFRPYFSPTDVFIRPLGEGGNAFWAFARLVGDAIRSLL